MNRICLPGIFFLDLSFDKDKEMKALVNDINSCGYLDNIPELPVEEVIVEGEDETPPTVQTSGR